MVVNHQEKHSSSMLMFERQDGVKAVRSPQCAICTSTPQHAIRLPPICCCAYSLLFHPSNNGRKMRENASVSMAQPLRFHYYDHKSFQYPCLSLLRSSSPSFSCSPVSDTSSISMTKPKIHTFEC